MLSNVRLIPINTLGNDKWTRNSGNDFSFTPMINPFSTPTGSLGWIATGKVLLTSGPRIEQLSWSTFSGGFGGKVDL